MLTLENYGCDNRCKTETMPLRLYSSYVSTGQLKSTAVLCPCGRHPAAAKSLQPCLIPCDSIDSSPPGSAIPGILPGKNIGVGCHFLLQCMKVESEKWKWSRSVVSDSSWPHGLQPTRLLCPWDFPGKSTGVGCQCLLWVDTLLSDQCTIMRHTALFHEVLMRLWVIKVFIPAVVILL